MADEDEKDDETRPFTPDWYSPTGHSILEIVDEHLKISHEEAAQRLDLSVEDFEKLMEGELALTDELAEKVAVLMAVDGREPNADFWKRREAHYRSERKRLTGKTGLE